MSKNDGLRQVWAGPSPSKAGSTLNWHCGQRIAGHLDAAEPAVALRRLEPGDVDLAPEYLLHAAHETAPRRPVDVAPEIRASHLQTVARFDQLVAEGPATPALTGW